MPITVAKPRHAFPIDNFGPSPEDEEGDGDTGNGSSNNNDTNRSVDGQTMLVTSFHDGLFGYIYEDTEQDEEAFRSDPTNIAVDSSGWADQQEGCVDIWFHCFQSVTT